MGLKNEDKMNGETVWNYDDFDSKGKTIKDCTELEKVFVYRVLRMISKNEGYPGMPPVPKLAKPIPMFKEGLL